MILRIGWVLTNDRMIVGVSQLHPSRATLGGDVGGGPAIDHLLPHIRRNDSHKQVIVGGWLKIIPMPLDPFLPKDSVSCRRTHRGVSVWKVRQNDLFARRKGEFQRNIDSTDTPAPTGPGFQHIRKARRWIVTGCTGGYSEHVHLDPVSLGR